MTIETAQVLLDANNITTIVNNINGLYDNLITYSIGVLALVGGVVPFIINKIQNKSFKDEQESLLKKINNELEAKKEEIKNTLKEELCDYIEVENAKLEAKLTEITNNLGKQLNIAKGRSFHLQANNSTDPAQKIQSCMWALENYINGDDERNARSVLLIIDQSVMKLNKTYLDNDHDPFECIKKIIELLEDNDINGRYSMNIDTIRSHAKAAEKREANTK